MWSKAIGVALVGVGFFSMLFGAWRTRKWSRHVAGDPPPMLGLWVMSAVFLAIALGIAAYIVVG